MNITRLVCSFLILGIFNNVYASEIWQLGKSKVLVDFNKDLKAYISKSCSDSDAKKRCFWDKIRNDKLLKNVKVEDVIGGKNPGAEICKKIPNAKLIFGENIKKQVQSFCLFEDKSFISSGAIMTEWLKQNK